VRSHHPFPPRLLGRWLLWRILDVLEREIKDPKRVVSLDRGFPLARNVWRRVGIAPEHARGRCVVWRYWERRGGKGEVACEVCRVCR
jgi:hypothetical protein